MLRLPRLSSASAIVDPDGKPNGTMILWWQQVVTQIEGAIQAIVSLTGIQSQFDQALQQAQRATTAAQAAATAASTAAAAAQAQADAAQAQADAARREAALTASYIDPASVLTASPTTITVAAHTRHYGDGTSVPVDAGTVGATASGDVDYVFYSDPARAGGSVTYQVATTQPAQTGDTHVVGAVSIPTTGTQEGGDGPRLPGYVIAKMPDV